AAVPMYSTVTGSPVRATDLDANYWARGIREPVRFALAIESLMARSVSVFLELGPHPMLCPAVTECGEKKGCAVHAIGTLRRGKEDSESLLVAAANLYVSGCTLDWNRVNPGRPVALPNYAFQRKRFWLSHAPGLMDGDSGPQLRYEIAWKETPPEHG